ncbi:MAG: hypothetical protein JSV19_00655 [Phycisphaerales bacterium]|nr:MAG: hypothetical protein JSV19_00655 [Phycisphaerales bacterium]
MWLSIFLIVLIAAITFFQSIHGLFSGLITCTLTILSCAFAFAIHEYVALELLIQWKPDFAVPLSLLLCFVVPLIVLRTAIDSLIRRSCLLPSLVDRVGGVVFGFVTAMLIIGMLTISLQLLPFGDSFLGFRRVNVTDPEFEPDDENNIWLKPDRFAAGFASMLSSGIFSGQRRWNQDHPDFVQEVGWSQTVPRDVRCFVPRNAIRFDSFTRLKPEYVYLRRPTTDQQGGPAGSDVTPEGPKETRHQFWALRFKPQRVAQDESKEHRFCPYQIRLVGDDRGVVRQYRPVAVMDSAGSHKYVRTTETRKGKRPAVAELYTVDGDGNISVAFELPEDFEPHFVEYKMGARARVTKTPDDTAGPSDLAAAPEPPTDAEPDGTRQPRRPQRGGRTHGANVQEAGFSDQLPHRLTGYRTVGDAEIRNGVMSEGHITANLDRQGTGDEVTRFNVPRGKALLQIDAVNLRAGSLLGRAKSFAVTTLRNYIVTDDRGGQYKICGQIAVAKVGTERIVEIQYYPEQAGSVGGVKEFSRIKKRHLDGPDYELYFLFLVDSGRKIVNFSTTGRRGGEDISDLDLKAP